MTVLYFILPLALIFAGAAVAAFAWTVRSGQLDDIETPPRRILFEDERAAPARILLHDERAEPARHPGGSASAAQRTSAAALAPWHSS